MSDITFSGTEITLNGKKWNVPYRIMQAMMISDHVLVLYDRMEGPSHRQFQNLEAYSLDGVRLWTAEHPDNATASSYVAIEYDSPSQVRAFNFGGFDCRIDWATGKLLKADFTK